MSKSVRTRRTGKEALHTRVVQDKRRKLTDKEAQEAIDDQAAVDEIHYDGLHEFDDQDMELDSPPFKSDALVDFENRNFKRINRWLTLSELDEKKRLSKLTPEESEL